MKPFKPIEKLEVYRRLADGKEVLAGQLVQNTKAVYFQYDTNYLAKHESLSPFSLGFNNQLNQAPLHPHQGLHGVFADSLPDGWGLLLMDRVFRQQGIPTQQITAMDRLAYIGDSGIGALSYRPVIDWKPSTKEWIDIATLGKQATKLFDGEIESVLTALANAGGSGGARPKALIYIDSDNQDHVSTVDQENLESWLIKFTSNNLLLGHEEGLCEAAYLKMAETAGIETPEWKLYTAPESSNAKAWLAIKRFDCPDSTNPSARYHTHTLCGLLDADFRQPSIDYEDLIKASQVLCKSPAVGQQQFTRAMFNLFADNQDDHSKNWSFLMDKGQWQIAPFYDVTFSPNPHNQHMTSYAGYGQQPTIKAIQKLAAKANFAHWKDAQNEISRVLDALSQWSQVAKELKINTKTVRQIDKQLGAVYKINKSIIVN